MVNKEREQELLAIIAELSATVAKLSEELAVSNRKIAELTEAINAKKRRKDSHNSSQPPSSDGYNKPAPKSLRTPSGKKPGGQNGHKGSGMAISMPDEEKKNYPTECSDCPMAGCCGYTCAGTHYTYDVEVITNIVAHKVMACNCPKRNGKKIIGEFPKEAPAVKQYGPNLRAFAVNLLTQGYVSIDRTRQILEGLGIPVSTGTLQNFLDYCAAETVSAADEIRRKVAALNVIHCDETGVDVNGKLHWMHCLCNDKWSYCTVHEKRGSAAMDEIGVIPSLDNSTLVHDFWSAYLKYDNVKHSFCNTHLERELIYAYETTGQTWANALNMLLSEMCGKRNELKKDGAFCYPSELLTSYFEQYDALVTEGLAANPVKETPKGKRGRKAKGKTRCLLERLRDYKADILRFASDWTVPFTNNEAERCVRFSKVKEKVSGCFRSKAGADNFMRIMSYIGSAKKTCNDCLCRSSRSGQWAFPSNGTGLDIALWKTFLISATSTLVPDIPGTLFFAFLTFAQFGPTLGLGLNSYVRLSMM